MARSIQDRKHPGVESAVQALRREGRALSELSAPAELFSKAGLDWLQAVELDEVGRQQRDSELRLLNHVAAEIAALDQILAEKAHVCEPVKLLMTLPGVNVTVAQTVWAALGDIRRFRDGDHAAAYLGLVPRTQQSAERCYMCPRVK